MSADPVAGNYRYFLPITTRWMDNDVYGHVNNVTYYSYFDTVANHFLITEGGLDIHHSPVIALVVESQCSYRAPVAYPDRLRAGLRVDRLGNRSVTYGVAIFTDTDTDTEAVAHGQFVHVFVDRQSRRAVPIPQPIRTALETLIQS
ncbi:MAG: thioesterase family protein [Actinomycetota bacterium]|nr:thioesterase family protein [Actinomycetota bacterium]